MNFARGKIPSRGKSPGKCMYNVPVQETAKHHAKFGWLPLSDVAAVTKPISKLFEIFWGAPNSPTDLTVSGPKFTIL